MTERRGLLLVLAGAACLYGLTAAFFDLMVTGVGADVGYYLVLATSLGSGHGLAYVNTPAALASTKFPFLFPALLAPVVAAFPTSMLAARLFAVLISVATAAVCYVYVRRVARAWALPITVLFAFNIATLYSASYPQSDAPFCIFLLLACTECASYAEQRPRAQSPPAGRPFWRWRLPSPGLPALSFYRRSSSFCCCAAGHRKRRRLLLCLRPATRRGRCAT